MIKKSLLILVAVIGFGLSANAGNPALTAGANVGLNVVIDLSHLCCAVAQVSN